MARRDEDDGEELLRPAGVGFLGKTLLAGGALTGLVAVGGALLIVVAASKKPETTSVPTPVTPVTVASREAPAPIPEPTAPPLPVPAPEAPPRAKPPTPIPPQSKPTTPPRPQPRPTPKPAPTPPTPKPIVEKANGVTLTVHSIKRRESLGTIEPSKGYSVYVADIEIDAKDAGVDYAT